MIELDSVTAGFHISVVCEKAAALAQPGESATVLQERWQHDFDAAAKAYRESPEYKERQRKEKEETVARLAAHLVESAQTEAEMRAAKNPAPWTPEQLIEYINSVTDRQHDFGTQGWLKEEAQKLQAASPTAHPDVRAHWKTLADREISA